MEGVKKMTLVPFQRQQKEITDNQPTNVKITDKSNKLSQTQVLLFAAKIFASLALIQAYDSLGRVKNDDGSFLDDSDIVNLIIYALTPGKPRKGETQFIHRLAEAKIPLEWIVNDDIKFKLQSIYSSGIKVSKDNENKVGNEDVILRPSKRHRDDMESSFIDVEQSEPTLKKPKRMPNITDKRAEEEPFVEHQQPPILTSEEDQKEDENIKPIKGVNFRKRRFKPYRKPRNWEELPEHV